jgi:hypothetical protein
MPELPESRSHLREVALSLLVGAFSIGAVETVWEGQHGDPPGGVHHPTQSIAKMAAMATTTP